MKSTTITIRISTELKDKLRKQAEKENRTSGNLINKVVTDYLNGQVSIK